MNRFGLYFISLASVVGGLRVQRFNQTIPDAEDSDAELTRLAYTRPFAPPSTDSLAKSFRELLFALSPAPQRHITCGRHCRELARRPSLRSRVTSKTLAALAEKLDVSGTAQLQNTTILSYAKSPDEGQDVLADGDDWMLLSDGSIELLNKNDMAQVTARNATKDPIVRGSATQDDAMSVRQCVKRLTKNLPRTTLGIPFSFKRRAVKRIRIAMQRAELSSLNREAAALEARASNMVLTSTQSDAERARLVELRVEAAARESNILRLTSSEPDTWCSSALRTMEALAASQYRPITVFLSEFERQPDVNAGASLYFNNVASVLRLGANLSLVQGYLGLPRWPWLMLHSWTIFLRARRLERYAPGILQALTEPVKGSALGGFSSRGTLCYLDLVEPHLDTILDRFDDIEPHLPFVLEHLDALAPYCGTLLKHLDGLLLYASTDGGDDDNMTLQLLDYVPVFAPMLDVLAPHLPLIRPHLKKLLPVLPAIAPYADRFAPYVSVSANADIILWYFGWVLRVPGLRRLLIAPGMPRLASTLARRLPRFPVRGRRNKDIACNWDGCDVSYVANAKRYYETIGSEDITEDVRTSVLATMSEKDAEKAWRRYRRKQRQLSDLSEREARDPNSFQA